MTDRLRQISAKSSDQGDGTLEITVVAQIGPSTISGSALILASEFEKRLPALREFPLTSSVIILSGGIFVDNNISLEIEKLHFSVHIISSTGRLVLRVKVFEEDFDYYERGFGCGGSFDYHIDYSGYAEFLGLLERMTEGEIDQFTFSEFADW